MGTDVFGSGQNRILLNGAVTSRPCILFSGPRAAIAILAAWPDKIQPASPGAGSVGRKSQKRTVSAGRGWGERDRPRLDRRAAGQRPRAGGRVAESAGKAQRPWEALSGG